MKTGLILSRDYVYALKQLLRLIAPFLSQSIFHLKLSPVRQTTNLAFPERERERERESCKKVFVLSIGDFAATTHSNR